MFASLGKLQNDKHEIEKKRRKFINNRVAFASAVAQKLKKFSRDHRKIEISI